MASKSYAAHNRLRLSSHLLRQRNPIVNLRKRYMWHDVVGAICYTEDPCGFEEIACRVGAMELHRVAMLGRKGILGAGDLVGMKRWSAHVLSHLLGAGIIETEFDANEGCNIYRLKSEMTAIPPKWWPTNSPVLSG